MVNTIIIGKRSNLSIKLAAKLKNSTLMTSNQFSSSKYKLYKESQKKTNIIINSFYPLSKIKANNIDEKLYVKKSIFDIVNVLDKLKNCRVSKIIYSSSSSVYVFKNSFDINNNQYLYARTKFLMENILFNFCKTNNIVLLNSRLFNIYGFKESNSIIDILINSIHSNKKIIINNGGKSIRDYIHVDDVIKIYKLLLSKKITKSVSFDVGTGKGISIKEILHLINTKNIIYSKNDNEINYSVANTYFLKKYLNFKKYKSLLNYLNNKLHQ